MLYVPLTKGREAIIDIEDFVPIVGGHSWHYTNRGYAATRINGKIVLMHRLITDATEGQEVDHKNGDKLDNRRQNLRVTTPSLNRANVGKREGCASRFKGVCYAEHSPMKPWRAYINYQGKRQYLGYYADEEDAARAYDRKAVALFGEFARLNFP